MSATCPQCGKPVPPSGLQGLCPECMLRLGAASQTGGAGETGPNGTKVTSPPPPKPEEIAGYFPQLEILECLGRGGMGVVYKARQTRLNRVVALKVLAPEKEKDPQFAERFMREAQALARLNHPNIVAVYDFGEAGGLFYLLMEFADGMSLRQLLQTRKLVPEEALAIVPAICEALQYAHEQGIVHRDIKPENVLLDKRGRVKLADFGIAKILGQTGEEARLTGATGVVGTPYYMAPEQVEKPTKVDHRADIYSLGVVFYEMLTGELPLGRFSPPSSRIRGVQMDVRLDEVVLHALEKEPERRYQQASQVKRDVETIATGSTAAVVQGVPGPSPFHVSAQARRRLMLWYGLVCCLVGLPVGLWLKLPGVWGLSIAGILIGSFKLGLFDRGGWRMPKLAGRTWALLIVAVAALVFVVERWSMSSPDLTLTGTVTDAVTGRPIQGARVSDNRYGAGAKEAPQAGWTDEKGQYSYRTWPEEHTVAASAMGYETKLASFAAVSGPASEWRRLDFALQPAKPSQTFAREWDWLLVGRSPEDYQALNDKEVTRSGKASTCLRSIKAQPAGFGTLMQTFKADPFRNHRVRMSAHVRSENVANWAGLWMRVDGPKLAESGIPEPLAFDNMEKRPIKGTAEWKEFAIVLDVPERAQEIAFGLLLEGKGRVWLDDLKFEIVGADVPATGVDMGRAPLGDARPDFGKTNAPEN